MLSFQTGVDILVNHSIFPEFFTQDEIRLAFEYFSIHEFHRNQYLTKKGDLADRAIVLLEGVAHVEIDKKRVAVLKQGYLFGESAFSSDAIRKADVIAQKDGYLAELTVKNYEKMIDHHPVLARHFKFLFNYVLKLHEKSRDIFFHKDETLYIALAAHNAKKQELIDFVNCHHDFFSKYPLIATDTTGKLLSEKLNIHLTRKVCSGPMGGDQEMGSLITHGNIVALFFFRDPLHPHAHHADIEALGRLCDVYQTPFATNAATAEAIICKLENK